MNIFEYYQNTLVIHAGWLYGKGQIMSKSNYKQLCHRSWLNVIRRGCKGTPALVEYDSIPERFREVIVEKVGDPKETKRNTLLDQLVYDQQAADFYNSYTLDSGKHLPKEAIEEYIANAIVLNGIQTIINIRKAKKCRTWREIERSLG